MKKALGMFFEVLFITLVGIWIAIIITEYTRYLHDEPMLIVLKEETLNYDDGHVYVYYGLGYKEVIYNRTSFYGKEFGHIFISVRDSITENS